MKIKIPQVKIPFPRFGRNNLSARVVRSNSRGSQKTQSLLSSLLSPEIRNKFLFTVFVVFIFRILSAVPLPGVNMAVYQQQFSDKSTSQISFFLTAFTGGNLDTPSIVGLGIGVYITASIIIQMLGMIIPRLDELTKEGNRGKQIIDQYTRYLTVPLSFIYGIAYLFLISQTQIGENANPLSGLIPRNPDGSFSTTKILFMALVLTAGSLLVMWLAELITEKGIGNGASILIMISILAALPSFINYDFSALNIGESIRRVLQGDTSYLTDPSMIAVYLIVAGAFLLTLGIVAMNESTRKLVIQYARRDRVGGAMDSNLPLKLNQSGVLPIIFASALLTVPQLILPLLQRVVIPDSQLGQFVTSLQTSFLFDQTSAGYIVIYFFAIIILSLMYVTINFRPDRVAEDLQKSGAFIPGIRPGKTTEDYITQVLLRLNFAGAIFLGGIALIPLLAGSLLQSISGYQFTIFSAIGGTSILIVVGVVLDTVRQVQSIKASQSYKRFV